MYEFSIKRSRLSLLGATTGGSLHLLLARYTTYKISDGCENRFLYYFTENDLIPYDMLKRSDRLLPSLQQVFIVVHLIGRVIYTFTDANGNDEAQRYYATKGRFYIEEGRRLFRERKHAHFQSFFSKSAEIFPRLCVNMQRFMDAMLILLEMNKNGDLEFTQCVDEQFVVKAKRYINSCLNIMATTNGEIRSNVSLDTCLIAGNLYDNYIFKTTIALFNLENLPAQSSIRSNHFRSLITEKTSIETRLLQLPYQFFFRSDLKQPTINEFGKKINAPFHHVNTNQLNDILNKLVGQKLLQIGNFISRPKAQQMHSYMKCPAPNDPHALEEFTHHLENYKIKVDEYKSLLVRSTLPNRCTFLPDAIRLLTTSRQHYDDCAKYGLLSVGMYGDICSPIS